MRKKIEEYCEKCNIPIPDDDEIFWAGVHKVLCTAFWEDTFPVSEEQYEKSSKWLKEHGYSCVILPDTEKEE